MRDKTFVNRQKRDEFNFSEANSEKLSATKFAASSSLLPELRLPVKMIAESIDFVLTAAISAVLFIFRGFLLQ